ncbi:hypothetical protein JST56_01405 [Candidatus Dependentiae bacterium]|nr:hypothetical protein [Candidatus Dependentiae bacterium]
MSRCKTVTLFLSCLMAAIASLPAVHALDIKLLSSSAEIAATNKAFVRFDLSPQDSALFKDTIKISSDNTTLQVIKWNMLEQPTSKYFSAFRKNKRIFTQSCTAQITVAINDHSKLFEQTHLHIAGISGRTDGKNYPYSFVIPLQAPHALLSTTDLILCTSTELSSTYKLGAYITSTTIAAPRDTLTHDFQLLEKFQGIWSELLKLFTSSMAKSILFSWTFLLIFLLIGLLIIWLVFTFLSKPINKAWITQGFELLGLLLGLTSLRFIAPFFTTHYASYLVTCALLVESVGLFCLLTGHEQSVWGKLKIALAWVCLVSPFPLVTYAYLARSGLT